MSAPSPSPSGRLNDRTAIITGTSSGLGRAIALAYIREGCSVACADITPTARPESPHETESTTLELLRREAPEERSMYVQCDVSRVEDVETVVERCVERWGRVDILVNNAGTTSPPVRLHESDDDVFDKVMAVNARSVYLFSKYVIRQMLKQEPHPGGDRGWIVNVASIAGLVGVGTPDYAASKGAVVQLTKSIAIDYARDRIHCNAICPGFIQTGLLAKAFEYMGDRTEALAARHPFRGLGEVGDVVGPAVFLASADARWVTGVPLAVDGGYTAQ